MKAVVDFPLSPKAQTVDFKTLSDYIINRAKKDYLALRLWRGCLLQLALLYTKSWLFL